MFRQDEVSADILIINNKYILFYPLKIRGFSNLNVITINKKVFNLYKDADDLTTNIFLSCFSHRFFRLV